MTKAIGIRLDNDFLKKIEVLSKEETLDRSSIIRKLVYLGYKNFVKNKALQKYLQGRITFSEAAYQSGLIVWEMQQYLVEEGAINPLILWKI